MGDDPENDPLSDPQPQSEWKYEPISDEARERILDEVEAIIRQTPSLKAGYAINAQTAELPKPQEDESEK